MKKNTLKLHIAKKVVIRQMLLLFTIFNIPGTLISQDTINPPPKGYDIYNADIPHGTTEIVSYYSSTVGINRNTRIYLPPAYNKDSSYNVLYLLHGIGGDINEWYNNGAPRNILDNLYARGRIAPMIVVLPNGRAMVDDSPGTDIFAADKQAGFANFEFELIKDLIPFIDTTYSVKQDRESRAIAGLSMGGGQALNFGLAHLDTFAWVGAFSPAPNTKAPESLIPNLEDSSKIAGLWISCGSADNLIWIAENTHNYMTDNNIEHFYLVEQGKGHDWSVWKPGLYHFTQRIFGQIPKPEDIIDISDDTTNTNIFKHLQNKEHTFFYDQNNQTIKFLDNKEIKNMRVYDINGRLMINDLLTGYNSFDISGLNKGLYVIVHDDGKKYYHNKLIKL